MNEAGADDLRIVAEGLLLPESPRWHDGRLWLSDWGAGQIKRIEADGAVTIIASVNALPFSFAFMPDGAMALIAGPTLSIRRPDGSFAPHADLSPLSAKPWNEIVVDATGRAYVNTIGFDFPGGAFRPGLVASVSLEGEVRLEAEDVAFPNGMAISPDGRMLVLGESYASCLTAFTIGGDGALTARRRFADLPGFHPDGITMDAEGAVWFADVPNRCCCRIGPDGTLLQRVDVDRGCFACMLGGGDGRTLFILAADWKGPQAIGQGGPSGRVLTVEVDVPRAGWP
ncbi:Sugar lactone lactonase YvrE [Kaistia soli DSM 19436]|uniref:Sugar lactone lactonase YvrE n=1 Tax=Kaistia soli DSM 19436 TaxID=1122133 RepID=A0A1M5DTU0_9HYPH|nr:SMP-30/gluconolactonase/LRE family protein [Kaistia soli]SHF70369.1 Sugar lactone lactonase YvrE [Kaistia soli DSM 19436]